MNLKDLILEGEQLRSEIKSDHINKENYERWIAKAFIFMKKRYPVSTMTKRFIEARESSAENTSSFLDTILSILKESQETGVIQASVSPETK